MIKYVTGNLLESNAQALVNAVNTVGVMGKGIALQFKKAFPDNFKVYEKACKDRTFKVGQVLVHEESLLENTKLIINFPTKTSWRLPSEYEYIQQGLVALRKEIMSRHIQSVAIPALGAGNGGLDWLKVKSLIENYLSDLEVDIFVYEPDAILQERLDKAQFSKEGIKFTKEGSKFAKKGSKLTPARAMLLLVLHDLVQHGELVNEFSAEKIVYFLQRLGAQSIFGLVFDKGHYGPYSGKVRHVLYYLNGSYITGYSSGDKKPFDELDLVDNTEDEIRAFLQTQNNQEELFGIVQRTQAFLDHFYSPFALELLSTVDFVVNKYQLQHEEEVIAKLSEWSSRKELLFAQPYFIGTALNHLKSYQLISW